VTVHVSDYQLSLHTLHTTISVPSLDASHQLRLRCPCYHARTGARAPSASGPARLLLGKRHPLHRNLLRFASRGQVKTSKPQTGCGWCPRDQTARTAAPVRMVDMRLELGRCGHRRLISRGAEAAVDRSSNG